MSTEHLNPSNPLGAGEGDREYGPTPAGAQYEHTDIDPAVGYKFGLWLSVAMLLSFGIVYGAFWFFERQERAANTAIERFPLAKDYTRPAPTPALQTQPFKDLFMLREEEAKRLQSYGWVDKDGGVTRIPIDRAMEIMIQRGFPTRTEPGDALNVVTQDSSSGRTVAPR
jgi:hypothetical protein